MAQCPLVLDGRAIGQVLWQREGGRVRVRARCPFEAGYIYRVTLWCADEHLPLGVMTPEGGEFVLAKTLARWPFPERGAVEARVLRSLPGEPGGSLLTRYRPVEPGFSTSDRLLNTAIGRQGDVLYSIDNGRLRLAFPLEIGSETPMAPFLAITRYVETEAGGFGLISFPQAIMVCTSSS